MHISYGIQIIRFILQLLFLFGFLGYAHAGPEPTPTDWLPKFDAVKIIGDDIVFEVGVIQLKILNGEMDKILSSPINMLPEMPSTYIPKKEECSVPNEVLSKFDNGYTPAKIWYCDLPDKIWFATGGYCGEGDDEPSLNQGDLYSYSPVNGKIDLYPGFLPRCVELAGLSRNKNMLLAVTFYQAEYGQGAGNVIILDLKSAKSRPKILRNPKATGAVVGMSAYDKQCDCLWFATEGGIERLIIGEGRWERRYFDYEITPDNRLALTLVLKKPSDKKMWLGRVLHNYPIEDLRGFVKAWNKSPVDENSYTQLRISPLLLPYYIAAIKRTKDWESDWIYSELMGIVIGHQDKESKEIIRAFIEKQLSQPKKLSRMGEIVSSAKKFGVGDAKKLEDTYFDDLLMEYFSGSKVKWSSKNDVVSLSFKHPEYLPKLRDYYQEHNIAYQIDEFFLDSAKGYSQFKGYEILASTVDAGQKRLKHRQELLRMCSRSETPRDENKLLEILQARLETDAQAKLNEPGGGEHNCIDSSYYWINYGGDAQIGRRVGIMLSLASERKELREIIIETLSRKFNFKFKNIDDWKRWWTITYAKGININGVCGKTACVGGSPCVSLGVPDGSSKCDEICQLEVVGKLYAVGVSVFTHPNIRSPKNSRGCVGYRSDIGGTEAGAKCIANALGYKFSAWGCNEDGVRYNVRTH